MLDHVMPTLSAREPELKAKLLTQLRREKVISRKAVIANEYVVGRSCTRADLAILESKFIGIEIKSEVDSLRRLSQQIRSYSQYFDEIILVVADKHQDAIPADIESLVRIWTVDRKGLLNAAPVQSERMPVDRLALSYLLTKEEKRRFLSTPDSTAGDGDRRAFSAAFRAKFGATSAAFWRQVGRRSVSAADLSRLSRFHEHRVNQRQYAEDRKQAWTQWADAPQRANELMEDR